MRLDDATLRGDVGGHCKLLYVNEVDIGVSGPGSVVDAADLLLVTHSRADGDALGGGGVLRGVVAADCAVGLYCLEVSDIKKVALALGAGSGSDGHLDVKSLVCDVLRYGFVRTYPAGLFRTAGVGTQFHLVGLGTDKGNALHLGKVDGKGLVGSAGDVFVLEQHRGAGGDLHRQGAAALGIDRGRRHERIGHHRLRVEFARPHPDCEHVHEGAVDQGHGKEALFERADGIALVDAAAVGIDAGPQALGGRFLGGLDIVVSGVDVLDCGAVSGHVALKAVGPAGDHVQQESAGRHGHAIHGAVCRHDGRKRIVLNEFLVRIKIEFTHVARIHVGTADVAVELAVVGEVVLGGRDGLHVPGIVAHKAADIPRSHPCGEEGILAE